tara:strand:- start:1927 stop:2157 length:231 start_codon:yes stop_codon:yes gene_type:complete
MTTAYSRIDRFLRQNLNDKDYPAYKDELDAICQAKLQRTWVGLTDEEQQQAYEEWQNEGWGVFYNAIEAKLKQKNG